MQLSGIQLLAVLVFLATYLTNEINCAKTEPKPQMGIPFAFKHVNSADFYDHLNQTTTKKPKAARSKRYAFSFKTLSDLDLPPTNEQLNGHPNSQSNFGEGNHELDRHSLDFLGRTIGETASSPESHKGRLTEKMIPILGAETQKTAENVTRSLP